MKFVITRNFMALCIAAAILGACSGSQLPQGPTVGALAKSPTAKSWMRAGARVKNLLYVSANDSGSIYVFTYPGGKLVGSISGLNRPLGLCSDSAGDVWVTTTGSSSGTGYMIEYEHGASTPKQTLRDSSVPQACSVDPKTGNLVAANGCPAGSCAIDFAVYAGASGTAKYYNAVAGFGPPFAVTYDNSGNIFAEGAEGASKQEVVWIPSGATRVSHFKLQPRHPPRGIQWDGRYLAITDPNGIVHRYAIKNSKGVEVGGAITLSGFLKDQLYWIQSSTLISPNSDSTVTLWAYPRGGQPTKSISIPNAPYGVAVSLAK